METYEQPMTEETPEPAAPAAPKEIDGKWRKKIAACDKFKNDSLLAEWKENVAYRKLQPFELMPEQDMIALPVDWSRTKNKQAQLFHQVPEIMLFPRQPEAVPVAPVFGAAVNFELTERIRLHHIIDECLGDTINAAGIGVAFTSFVETYEEKMALNVDASMYAPEDLAIMQADGRAQMVSTKVPVFRGYVVDRVSPANFLWPVEFTGSDWQRADFLGFRGRMPKADAIRLGWINDNYECPTQEERTPESTVNEDAADESRAATTELVEYEQLFYRRSSIDPAEKDPRAIWRVVLVKGKSKPVVEEPLRWQQRLGGGKWLGLTRFPISVLTLTSISDEAIPPSDSRAARPQVKEAMRFRSQMLKQRDRSMPLRWVDANMVDDEIVDQMRKGVYQDMIPMNGPGDRAIGEVARANYPRENYEAMNVIKADMDEAWAMSANQSAAGDPSVDSATEAKIIQGNTNVRQSYEQARVLNFIVEIAENVAALMQMFQDTTEYVAVVGPDGVQKLEQWSKAQVRFDFLFKAKPDAALKLDIGQKKAEALNLYKLLRRDALVNPTALVAEVLIAHGYDPARLAAPPPPPPQSPPPKLTITFKGEDLSGSPICLAIFMNGGKPPDEKMIEAAKLMLMDSVTPSKTNPAAPMPPNAAVEEQLKPTPEQSHGGMPEKVDPLGQRYERGAQS